MSDLTLFTLFDRSIPEVGSALDSSRLQFERVERYKIAGLETQRGIYTCCGSEFRLWDEDYMDEVGSILPRAHDLGLKKYRAMLSHHGPAHGRLRMILPAIWNHLDKKRIEFSVLNSSHCPPRLETFYHIIGGHSRTGRPYKAAANQILDSLCI